MVYDGFFVFFSPSCFSRQIKRTLYLLLLLINSCPTFIYKQALLFMLIAFCYNTNFINGSEAETDCFDTIHIRKIKEKEIHIHVPEKYTDHFPSEPTEVPVKRIHSRHRRFVAPGALWQNRVCSSSRSYKSLKLFSV